MIEGHKYDLWLNVNNERLKYPYRIVETYPTTDGYRSRLTAFCFADRKEAETKLAELQQK